MIITQSRRRLAASCSGVSFFVLVLAYLPVDAGVGVWSTALLASNSPSEISSYTTQNILYINCISDEKIFCIFTNLQLHKHQRNQASTKSNLRNWKSTSQITQLMQTVTTIPQLLLLSSVKDINNAIRNVLPLWHQLTAHPSLLSFLLQQNKNTACVCVHHFVASACHQLSYIHSYYLPCICCLIITIIVFSTC